MRASIIRWFKKYPSLTNLSRRIHLKIWWMLFFLSRVYPNRVMKLPEILCIPPGLIKLSANAPDSLRPTNMCIIVDGDWDLCANRLENVDVFNAFEQRFVEGSDWQNSRFYKRVVKQILEGQTKWGCRSADEFEERLKEIDDLFNEIRENGYKTQLELGMNRPWAEIAVRIGRDGQIILLDGRHRLAIARILDLEAIPVVVWAWHRDWDSFK